MKASGPATFLLILLAVFGSLAYFADPFLLTILSFFFLYVAFAVAVVSAIQLIFSRRDQTSRSALRNLFAGLAIAVATLFVVPANTCLMQRAEVDAKAYPYQIRHLLEAYRTAHGGYPTTLDVLTHKPAIPRFLRAANAYRSDGTTYSFTFAQSGGFMSSFWEYSSQTGTWEFLPD